MTTKNNPAGSSFTFVAADERGNSVTASSGGGLLLTGATGGFLYVPGMTGAPASTSGPTGYTGTVAHVFDVSNNMPWYLNPVNTFGGSTGATPSWVAGNGQVLIQRIILAGATGAVTFSGIPQVFNNLKLLCICKSVAGADFSVRFNGDSGANYDSQLVNVSGSTVSGQIVSADTQAYIGNIQGTSSVNYPGTISFEIPAYTSTTFFKTIIGNGGSNTSASGSSRVAWCTWRNTTNITSISCQSPTGNLATGSLFYLYGIW